jgi:hypothetical protein
MKHPPGQPMTLGNMRALGAPCQLVLTILFRATFSTDREFLSAA